ADQRAARRRGDGRGRLCRDPHRAHDRRLLDGPRVVEADRGHPRRDCRLAPARVQAGRAEPGSRHPAAGTRGGMTNGTGMRALFWCSTILVAYVYVGYPLLLRLWARLRPRPYRLQSSHFRLEPSVSIVIAARNEGARLAARIENLLGLDYPARKR